MKKCKHMMRLIRKTVALMMFSVLLHCQALANNQDTVDAKLLKKSSSEAQIRSLSGPKRVLFTGNSFSFYNNGIHNHLGGLIRSAGAWNAKEYRMRLMTLSGAHVYENLPSIAVMLKREDQVFDTLVIQGHSNEALVKSKRKRFEAAVEKAVEFAREQSIAPYLFMTWEYKGDTDMGADIARAFKHLGKAHGVPVVPVGLAFARAQAIHPELELYVPDVLGLQKSNDDSQAYVQALRYKKDLKHPSNAGTYLSACVFYATFYQQSPEGLIFTAGLTDDEARKLQSIAWETVKEFSK